MYVAFFHYFDRNIMLQCCISVLLVFSIARVECKSMIFFGLVYLDCRYVVTNNSLGLFNIQKFRVVIKALRITYCIHELLSFTVEI